MRQHGHLLHVGQRARPTQGARLCTSAKYICKWQPAARGYRAYLLYDLFGLLLAIPGLLLETSLDLQRHCLLCQQSAIKGEGHLVAWCLALQDLRHKHELTTKEPIVML